MESMSEIKWIARYKIYDLFQEHNPSNKISSTLKYYSSLYYGLEDITCINVLSYAVRKSVMLIGIEVIWSGEPKSFYIDFTGDMRIRSRYLLNLYF